MALLPSFEGGKRRFQREGSRLPRVQGGFPRRVTMKMKSGDAEEALSTTTILITITVVAVVVIITLL